MFMQTFYIKKSGNKKYVIYSDKNKEISTYMSNSAEDAIIWAKNFISSFSSCQLVNKIN